MSILLPLKVHYKSQTAVTTRQGHQKRLMKIIKCKKNKKQTRVIFSSQGKTFRAHWGAKRKQSCCHRWMQGQANADLLNTAALASVSDRPKICFLLCECWTLQCAGWCGTTRAPVRRPERSFTSRHSCRTAVSEVWLIFLQSALSTVQIQTIAQHRCRRNKNNTFDQSIVFICTKATVLSFVTDGKRV